MAGYSENSLRESMGISCYLAQTHLPDTSVNNAERNRSPSPNRGTSLRVS
jgi:hypothetical protein